jgi:hypothetical protein
MKEEEFDFPVEMGNSIRTDKAVRNIKITLIVMGIGLPTVGVTILALSYWSGGWEALGGVVIPVGLVVTIVLAAIPAWWKMYSKKWSSINLNHCKLILKRNKLIIYNFPYSHNYPGQVNKNVIKYDNIEKIERWIDTQNVEKRTEIIHKGYAFPKMYLPYHPYYDKKGNIFFGKHTRHGVLPHLIYHYTEPRNLYILHLKKTQMFTYYIVSRKSFRTEERWMVQRNVDKDLKSKTDKIIIDIPEIKTFQEIVIRQK